MRRRPVADRLGRAGGGARTRLTRKGGHAIRHEATFEVPRPVEAVYGFLADVTRTPSWLSRCVELKQLSPGPLAVGSKLSYTYREGSRQGVMEGEVATLETNRKLLFHYRNRMLEVRVGFDLDAAGSGTRVRHHMEITPRIFLMRLLQPVMRMALKKQTAKDIAKLRQLLSA